MAERRSRFDELRELYIAWNNEYSVRQGICRQFPGAFADGFREFVGAPASYDDFVDGGKTKPYVGLYRAELTATGAKTWKPFDQFEMPEQTERGWYGFFLGIVIDRQPSTLPNLHLFIDCEFLPLADRVEFRCGTFAQVYALVFGRRETFEPVFHEIYELFEKRLRADPIAPQESKIPIGFALSPGSSGQ
jgi:hypothetical protein